MDQLSSLPGEPALSKEAAWQRLHARLQQKKQGTWKSGYGIAAATLLVVLSWLLWKPAGHQMVRSNRSRLPAPVAVHPQAAPATQAAVPVVVHELAAGRMVPNGSKSKERPIAPVSARWAPVPEVVQAPVQKVAVEAAPVAEASVPVIAAQPAQKRMKVVHINELGSALPETLMVRHNGAPYLQAKLSEQEGFSGFYTGRNTSDDIIKFKLSSSN